MSVKLSVTMVVIYNHYMPDNIEKVEYLYNKRFSKIYHLLPLSRSEYKSDASSDSKDKDSPPPPPPPQNHKFPNNIIRVRSSTYANQAHLVDGYKHYKNKTDHYLFVQDDVMLHPKINEHNYQEYFNLSRDDGFMEHIINLSNSWSLLPWKETLHYVLASDQKLAEGKMLKPSMLNYLRHSLGLNIHMTGDHTRDAYDFPISEQELDIRDDVASYDEAMSLFKEHGLPTRHIDKKKAAKRTKIARRYSEASHLNPNFLNHPMHSYVAKLLKQADLEIEDPAPKATASEIGNHNKRNLVYQIRNKRIEKVRQAYHRLLLSPSYFIYYRDMLRAILRICLTGKDTYRYDQLSYPFARSPCDVFIVPSKAMKRFIAQCDLFAGLVCELAIPTAFLLSTKKIVQAADLHHKKYNYIVDDWNKIPAWTSLNNPMRSPIMANDLHNRPAFITQSKTIDAVMSNWQDDYIYVHPVKLSSLPKN